MSCRQELRLQVFFALQKAKHFVKLSKVAGGLAQTAASCSLAVMLPNPNADLSDNSLVRKRDFMDPQRKKQRTGQGAFGLNSCLQSESQGVS